MSAATPSRPSRIACLEIAQLPLQLLLAQHPEWAEQATVVVDADKPQGIITATNAAARRSGILPGMRYAQALSLARELRAGTVSAAHIQESRKAIVRLLRQFSPRIDAHSSLQGDAQRPPQAASGEAPPNAQDCGSFFIDASGLQRIYPSLEYWARAIHAKLQRLSLRAALVIGHERFSVYALAKALSQKEERPGSLIFGDGEQDGTREDEQRRALAVPLTVLALEPKTRALLSKLGVHTVGALLALPEAGLRDRFGPQVFAFAQLGKGRRSAVFQTTQEQAPVMATVTLDDAVGDCEQLLFIIKRALHPLLMQLAERGEAAAGLSFVLTFERGANAKFGAQREEAITPAEPSLNTALLLDLIRLRLQALWSEAPQAVSSLCLTLASARATREQLGLFVETHKRDLRAAERAFARLRAERGADAVLVARLRDGHFPEQRFAWAPLSRVSSPSPRTLPVGAAPAGLGLVRRFITQAPPLPARRPHRNDGWLLGGLVLGSVDKLTGPFLLCDHLGTQRDYYFAHTQRGDVLWVYQEHPSGQQPAQPTSAMATQLQWLLAGRVE